MENKAFEVTSFIPVPELDSRMNFLILNDNELEISRDFYDEKIIKEYYLKNEIRDKKIENELISNYEIIKNRKEEKLLFFKELEFEEDLVDSILEGTLEEFREIKRNREMMYFENVPKLNELFSNDACNNIEYKNLPMVTIEDEITHKKDLFSEISDKLKIEKMNVRYLGLYFDWSLLELKNKNTFESVIKNIIKKINIKEEKRYFYTK